MKQLTLNTALTPAAGPRQETWIYKVKPQREQHRLTLLVPPGVHEMSGFCTERAINRCRLIWLLVSRGKQQGPASSAGTTVPVSSQTG